MARIFTCNLRTRCWKYLVTIVIILIIVSAMSHNNKPTTASRHLISDSERDKIDNHFLEDLKDDSRTTTASADNMDKKVILWHMPDKDATADDYELNCGDYICYITNQVALMEMGDAVVVDGYQLSHSKDQGRPVRRGTEQVWIFYSSQPWSAYGSNFSSKWNSMFNWTYTYRRDSDFTIGGQDIKKSGVPSSSIDWGQIMQLKTKDVLWIVNDCKSDNKREEYVNEMKKYIDVDIMGECGSPICTDNDASCYEKYHFYLSFESTHCKDYITDSFYKTFRHPIVPVVRGGADYKTLYQDKMYIDAADFTSARELAEYLKHLIHEDGGTYLDFLKTKQQYKVVERPDSKCILCTRLHLEYYRRTYPDISNWMNACSQPT